MGKPFSVCFKNKRKVTLLILGLDNAGKTSAIKNFLREENESVVPTVGFSTTEVKRKNLNVTVYDLGGGKNIRAIWTNYFALVHGVIFVVDSSDSQRLEEGKRVIENVIKDRRISGKPILLLVNKQDIEGALNEVELCASLNIEDIINEYRCPTRVENCSALSNCIKGRDRGIELGFKWILDYIDKHYVELSLKVGTEMEEQKIQEDIERKERLERVMKIREEREKMNGTEEEDLKDSNTIEHNPFRPLEEIAICLSQKDSALRKASVGANGKEEIPAEVTVHRSNNAEEVIPTPLGPVREKTIEDIDFKTSLPIHSPELASKQEVKKKVKRKPFKNKIDPLKVPLYVECSLPKEIIVPASTSNKVAWNSPHDTQNINNTIVKNSISPKRKTCISPQDNKSS